tara:strand:- start:1716 stop:2339 length:624 start_codon:yes stop_codon:yes gene_type:complete
VRQHVNPLSQFFQKEYAIPNINNLYEYSHLPLHLDIGCGNGEYLLDLAQSNEDINYLGVEIRYRVIKNSLSQIENMELKNVNFIFGNANVSLGDWLKLLPKGILNSVSIQFPDPWFKKRHHKRRVLQPKLLQDIISSLDLHKEIYIQSDVYGVFEYMDQLIISSNRFMKDNNKESLLTFNKNNLITQREKYVKYKGMPIYSQKYLRI